MWLGTSSCFWSSLVLTSLGRIWILHVRALISPIKGRSILWINQLTIYLGVHITYFKLFGILALFVLYLTLQRTRPDFEWSKRGWFANSSDFEWNSQSGSQTILTKTISKMFMLFLLRPPKNQAIVTSWCMHNIYVTLFLVFVRLPIYCVYT